MTKYVPLHQHSTSSLCDALGTVKELIKAAVDNNMPAIALTEHGNIKPFPELYKYSKEAGIKPIFGIEAYFTDEDLDSDAKKPDYTHVVLLAQNLEGYNNIVKLSSIANTECRWNKPCISWKEVEKYNSGIITLSACAGGLLNKSILTNKDFEFAEKRLKRWNNIFEDRFYLELQKHDTTCPELITLLNPQLEAWAKKYNLPLVVTNDSHYLCPGHKTAHKVVCAKRFNKKFTDKSFSYIYDDSFYFKNEADMLELFPDNVEAVYESGNIADQIENIDPQAQEYNLPKAIILGQKIEESEGALVLRDRCEEALRRKNIPKNKIKEYEDRLNYELEIITKFGFCNYFLIVSEELAWCRQNNIGVGPGRGSAGNSLVNYLCGITVADPVYYNLDFSRFLNQGRVRIDPETGKEVFSSMIDVDCDISQEDRDRFLEHIKERYGNVYHLGTNGRFTAKTALKTAGSAFDIPFKTMNQLSSLVLEKEPGTTTLVSIDWNMTLPEVANFVKKNKLEKVVEAAKGLEGGLASSGVHASGVIISEHDISSTCPIRSSSKHSFPVTEYDMNAVENFCKELKFDFLGLRTVSVVQRTEELVLKNYPDAKIPEYGEFPDTDVYKAIHGLDEVFQLGSPLAQKYYKQIDPKNINELSDVIALIRPGAINWADMYVSGGYSHQIPIMNTLLKETRGIMIYQEQIMEVAKTIAGFSSEKADDLRKACGKKKVEDMKSVLSDFESGALKNGYSKAEIQYIIQQIMDAALYSFNLGHSLAYAILAYKTLYLKHYYPAEFYNSVLNTYLDKSEDLEITLQNVVRNGIPLLPPDINKSDYNFSVDYDEENPSIRIGLRGIKGVGEKAVQTVMDNRPYTKISEFIEKINKRSCNAKVQRALIYSGAMDNISIDGDRMNSLKYLEGDANFELSKNELALEEKNTLGMFFSFDPYSAHGCFDDPRCVSPANIVEMMQETGGSNWPVTGFIEKIQVKVSKKKNKYIEFQITDGINRLKCIGFQNIVENYTDMLTSCSENLEPVTVSGSIEIESGGDIEDVTVSDLKLKVSYNGSPISKVEKRENSILSLRVDEDIFETVENSISGGTKKVFLYYLDNNENICGKVVDSVLYTQHNVLDVCDMFDAITRFLPLSEVIKNNE